MKHCLHGRCGIALAKPRASAGGAGAAANAVPDARSKIRSADNKKEQVMADRELGGMFADNSRISHFAI